jgi:hypothetical protein
VIRDSNGGIAYGLPRFLIRLSDCLERPGDACRHGINVDAGAARSRPPARIR